MLVLALAALFVYLRVSNELTGAIDDGLEARAADLAALVTRGSGPPDLSGALFEGEEGFSEVVGPGGRVVASTLPAAAEAALAPAEARQAAREAVLIDGRAVSGVDGEARILAAPAGSAGDPLVVVAGASTEDREEALAGIAGAFLIGTPVALLLASGLGYLLAARALAPVEAMRRRAADITLERSGERLPLPAADDELQRLGRTLNAMLDRLEASLQRERVFVADASHELRTPLAVLRAELELAERPGRDPEELRAALRSAAEEVERLTRLAEDLLVIARSDQGRLPIRRVEADIGELLARVRARFEGRARQQARGIAVKAPEGLRVEVDALRVEQAVGNLVDNALRYGKGGVLLSAEVNGDSLVLEVSDEGRGLPAEFRDKAFERFTRADEGRSGGGSGLGLAIVRAIARAHGGDATIAADADAAMVVRVELRRDRVPR